jgi:cytochrome b involved in lipid metabolism
LSDVISVRVPKDLKEKMKRYRIDWSKEIRKFIEERIRVLELLEVLDDIEKRAKRRKTKVNSVKLIRETREER